MNILISNPPRSGIRVALAMIVIGMGILCAAPVHVIFDTDMGGDCDDVGALFVLHGALERGEVDLLATMGCVSSDTIAPAIDGINRWFGRPGIPVGSLKDPGLLEGPHYTEELAKRYPSRFPSSKDYPDAVRLYRRLLAAQPDQSVVIVAVGPLRNIANLLESGADASSDLDGADLVMRKVKRLDVMGGKYPPQVSKDAKDAEWNFAQSARSAAKVCKDWPTPILFNGAGGSTLAGRRATYDMPEHNPLTMAYTLYPGTGYGGDRMSWDPISGLVTVRGAEPFYEVVDGGRNIVDPESGSNRWEKVEGGRHSYLVLKSKKAEVEAALEDYMVAGKGRPADLRFNHAYYGIKGGTCQFSGTGDDAARKAFDGDSKTMWQNRAESSWLQCQFGEGKRQRVTSYSVTADNMKRLPRSIILVGSNDGGTTWTVLDEQSDPDFTNEVRTRDFQIARPGKWSIYRLQFVATDAGEGVQIAEIELNEQIRCQLGIAVVNLGLDHQKLYLDTARRATLNATLSPLNSWDRHVAWVSSDQAIAEVRGIGEQCAIVAGKKPGTATITASVGGASATVMVTVAPSPLPAGWRYLELGDPPMPGELQVANDSFSITGIGHEMTAFWERVRDQGSYVYQLASGDFDLSARLRQLAPNVGGPAYQWDNRPPTASGLMFRESLTDSLSRYVLVQVEASGKLVARWRDTISQDDNQEQNLGVVELPVHLKLLRKGKSIQIFTSVDGQHWGEPKFMHPSPIGEGATTGMFVCSGNTFATTTASFDGVQMKE